MRDAPSSRSPGDTTDRRPARERHHSWPPLLSIGGHHPL